MRKNILLVSGLLGLLTLGNTLHAQEFRLSPTPQTYSVQEDSIALPAQYQLQTEADEALAPASVLLRHLLPESTSKASFRISLGIKGDKTVKRYNRYIPETAEGYYLKIDKKGIVIAGTDARGAYYGVQTLAQLLTLDKLPQVEITDYPDIPYRGVVEGFYGQPWSHEARLSQLDFYGRNKMNVYIYGPKDDPYHSTPNWRKPYPEKEAKQLQELVERAKQNNVIFYWAIHPGQDIKWNDEDRELLLKKFESMYDLGVRGFAVFFDDISGEGTKADKQAELLNYIDEHFIQTKGDVSPLIMCPTEYNKSWTNVEGGYLTTLGEKLNPDIQIMWTGDRVVANIDKQSMEFINPLIRRKAYIWWNYPVSDYVQDHILMGPTYGNGTDIKDDMTAFVSNPMEHAEASKISLYSVADYTWNLEDYDSQASWHQALRVLMPKHADYLETFAIHSSDLGKNNHKLRREESQNIRPALDALCQTYKKNGQIDKAAFDQVKKECEKICEAADKLIATDENPALTEEMAPWLIYFKQLGLYGQSVLHVLEVKQDGKQCVKCALEQARTQRIWLEQTGKHLNEKASQPGVKCGGTYLLPAFDGLLEAASK